MNLLIEKNYFRGLSDLAVKQNFHQKLMKFVARVPNVVMLSCCDVGALMVINGRLLLIHFTSSNTIIHK